MFPIDFNFLTADDVYDVSDSQDYVKKNDTFETWRQKTNWLIQKNTREIVLGTETSGNYVATIAGTTNQVNVSGSGSETAAVTLSLPQSIGTTSSPTFGSLVITNGIQSGSVTTSGLTTTGTLSSGGATFTGNTSAQNLTVSNTLTSQNVISTPSIRGIGTTPIQVVTPTLTGTTNATDIIVSNNVTAASVYTPLLKAQGTNAVEVKNANLTGSSTAQDLTVFKSFTAESVTTPSISSSGVNTLQIGKSNFTSSVTGSTLSLTGTASANQFSGTSLVLTGSGQIPTLSATSTSTGTLSASGASTLQSLTATTGTFSGNVTVNGSNSVLGVTSGKVSLNGINYTFPESLPTGGINYLKLGSGNSLEWNEIVIQESNIVLEDVVPIGVIVKWDDSDGVPNSKWSYCNDATIDSLNLTADEELKLRAIYGNLPTSKIPNLSGYIIKIKNDDIIDFRVTLGDGLTGTKAGGSVSSFNARSASGVTSGDRAEVSLKINKDSTLTFNGGLLGVADGQFLSVVNGGSVGAQTRITGGNSVTTATSRGYLLVGSTGTSSHVALDFNTIQAKGSTGGAGGILYVNPVGGNVDIGNSSSTVTIEGKLKVSQTPSTSTDVVRLTDLSSYVPTSNGTASGLSVTTTPSSDNHVVRKIDLTNGYLPLTGGSITGGLSVSSAPSNNTDVVRKVDLGAYLPLTGGTLTNGGTITLAAAPSADMHAVTKKYVDDYTVSSTGDTMTGRLVIPTQDVNLSGLTGNLIIGATDGYHIAIDDNEIQAKENPTTVDTLYLNALGGDVYLGNSSSKVLVSAVPSTDSSVVNRKYLTDNFVNIDGSTMTGPLYLSEDPTDDRQAVTKQYVDNLIGEVSLKFSVDMREGGNIITEPDAIGPTLNWQRGSFNQDGTWVAGAAISDVDKETANIYGGTQVYYFKIFYNKNTRGYHRNPYNLLEPGHWIFAAIPKILHHTWARISHVFPENGEMVFAIPHGGLPAGFKQALVNTKVLSGNNFLAFQATADGLQRAVIVSPYDRKYTTTHDGCLCFVNLKEGYSLPFNWTNYATTKADLYATSTFSNYSNGTNSSTLMTLRRMEDYIGNGFVKGGFWYQNRVNSVNEDTYSFDYKTIPLGIGTATRFACIDIRAEGEPVNKQKYFPEEYISFASFGYNYSGNVNNPLGTKQKGGNNMVDDSLGMKFGSTTIVNTGSYQDCGYSFWDPTTNVFNVNYYTTSKGGSKPVLFPKFTSPRDFKTTEIYWPFGNEGRGPQGFYGDVVFMVRVTNRTTGQHRIYKVPIGPTYGYGHDYNSKYLWFKNGTFYWNYNGVNTVYKTPTPVYT